MQFKGVEKDGEFTTLYYNLTWQIGWEQIISFIDVIIKNDFIKDGLQSIEVGLIAGANSVDVTEELKDKEYEVKNTLFSKKESGYIVIAGHSSIMDVAVRITIWNQLDRFLLQLYKDKAIDQCGEHCYDKYADSIEILAHINYTKSLI